MMLVSAAVTGKHVAIIDTCGISHRLLSVPAGWADEQVFAMQILPARRSDHVIMRLD